MPGGDRRDAVGVAVPLNADARGPLLLSQIERADVSLLIVRADMLEWIAALPSLGQTELVVVIGDEPVPAAMAGVPSSRWDEWLQPRVRRARAPAARVGRTRCDRLHLRHHRSRQGRRAHPPLLVPLLGDHRRLARACRGRVLTARCRIYHGGALHLIANGRAARRRRRAPAVPLLAAPLLGRRGPRSARPTRSCSGRWRR